MTTSKSIESALESDLSGYGYDMVTATTQVSMNATMKEMLYRMEPVIFETYYRANITEGGTISYEECNYVELKESIGMDLFDIPSDETNSI